MNFLRSLYRNIQARQLVRMRELNAKLTQCMGHEFKIIAAKSGKDDTALLQRCKHCGVHVVFSLSGVWTVDELLRNESEFTELERLAAK